MTDVFCLIIWISYFIHGIYCCIKKKEVDKIGFMGAVLVCIAVFAERVWTSCN